VERLTAKLTSRDKRKSLVDSNIRIGIKSTQARPTKGENSTSIRRQKSFDLKKSNSGIEDVFRKGRKEVMRGMMSFREADFSGMRPSS
jgi:hypothetical protein